MKRIKVLYFSPSLTSRVTVDGRPIYVSYSDLNNYGAEIHYEEGRPSDVVVISSALGSEVEDTFKYLGTLRGYPYTSSPTGVSINGQDLWTTKTTSMMPPYHVYWKQNR